MDVSLTGIAPRQLTAVLTRRLAEEPAIVLNGPRTVGKSTLLAALAQRLGRVVVDCDDPATRAAVRNGPGRYVLAGSTRYATLPEAGQALTGRVDILEVLPLAQVEIDGCAGEVLVH